MSLDPTVIFDLLQSHAMASGYFEAVNGHETTNPPGHGLSVGFWVSDLASINGSGLNSTSARVEFTARIYTSMQSGPLDAVDPNVLTATGALMEAYNGDFELGGNARQVDIFGRWGERLRARSAYLDVDQTTYRVMDITIPVIVNDAWTQEA